MLYGIEDKQRLLFNSIKNSFIQGRLAHSYLIIGNINSYGILLVSKIVQLLFCSDQDITKKPCQKCSSCLMVERREHPDLLWIEPQKKSRAILVEQVAMLRRHIMQTAIVANWKIAVLVNAERMNVESSNMLLKILEEPPKNSIFLLLVEKVESLLPTIVSRCQKLIVGGNEIDITGISPVLMDILKKIVVSSGDVVMALKISKEICLLLKSIYSEVEKTIKQEFQISMDIDNLSLAQHEKTIQSMIEARYRDERTKILKFLLVWYRDIILCYLGVSDKSLFYYKEEIEFLKNVASRLNFTKILNNINAIENAYVQLEQHLPESSVFEKLMLNISCG